MKETVFANTGNHLPLIQYDVVCQTGAQERGDSECKSRLLSVARVVIRHAPRTARAAGAPTVPAGSRPSLSGDSPDGAEIWLVLALQPHTNIPPAPQMHSHQAARLRDVCHPDDWISNQDRWLWSVTLLTTNATGPAGEII